MDSLGSLGISKDPSLQDRLELPPQGLLYGIELYKLPRALRLQLPNPVEGVWEN